MHLGTFRERVDETSASRSAVDAGASDADEDLQHSIDFSPAEFESEATEFSSEMFAGEDLSAADESGSLRSGSQNMAVSGPDDEF